MVHSTGHKSRLHRELDNSVRFGSESYSKVELIVELGASMLCGVSGISPGVPDNSASYLQSWISRLRGDSRLISAASAAQKAYDLFSESLRTLPKRKARFPNMNNLHQGPVSAKSVSISHDGKKVAIGYGYPNNVAKVIDASSGQELFVLVGHHSTILSVSWSPDGKRLATGSQDNTAKIWNAGNGKEQFTLAGDTLVHSQPEMSSVVWSPDGTRLATVNYGGPPNIAAIVWNTADGQRSQTLKMADTGHRMVNEVRRVAWSSDGHSLLTADASVAKVWDVETGHELRTLTLIEELGHNPAWAYSPDGRLLALSTGEYSEGGNYFRTATIWTARTGKMLIQTSSSAAFESFAWSPDERRLATGMSSSSTKVWGAENGRELFTFTDRAGGINSVTWSRDGKQLLSAGDDGQVRTYALDVPGLLQLAQQRVTEFPSQRRCRAYLHVDKCPTFPDLK